MNESGMRDGVSRILKGISRVARNLMHKIVSGGRPNGVFGGCSNTLPRKTVEGEAITRADALRDAGHFAQAAQAYATALAAAPSRNDLRVQRANMLKDAQCLRDAILVYRIAEVIEPAEQIRADIHLQWARALWAAGDPLGAATLYETCIAETLGTEIGSVALAEFSHLRRQYLTPYWL